MQEFTYDVTYVLKKLELSYTVNATDATAARKIADTWFGAESGGQVAKKVTVKAIVG